MAEISSENPLPSAVPAQAGLQSQSKRFWMLVAGKVVCIAVGAVFLGRLIRMFISQDPEHAAWWWQILLAVVAIGCSALVAIRQWRYWSQPLREMHELIPKVRAGEIPIEELSSIGGGMRSLVPLLQDLMREVRQQRAAVAELNEEIRQRVAQRTDKLERTIGSLRQQATKDPLTGLLNRRALDAEMPAILEKCTAAKVEFCVMMIDVDNFKPLNDTLGHAAGDEFLKSVAQLIRSSIRPEDMAFRCGGDEFVILLPGCAVRPATEKAKRLTSLVEQLAKTLKLTPPPGLSIGLAAMSEMAEPSVEKLLARADQRLYEIKAERPSTRNLARKAG